MAESADQPSQSDVDSDKSELKAVGSKQRLAKQAEVEVVEETESSKSAAGQKMADNSEDQSPNSDESDHTVVYTGQWQRSEKALSESPTCTLVSFIGRILLSQALTFSHSITPSLSFFYLFVFCSFFFLSFSFFSSVWVSGGIGARKFCEILFFFVMRLK